MEKELLQAILGELKILNDTQVENMIHLMNIDHKLDLILENNEKEEEFLEKISKNAGRTMDYIDDLRKDVVRNMPNFVNIEYILEGEFTKIKDSLNKIEGNTR